MLKAREIDTYQGNRVFKVPVLIRCNDSVQCRTVAEIRTTVISRSAAEAANWVVDTYNRPETEVYAYGPRGGEIRRYIGWESGLYREMMRNRHGNGRIRQLKFERF